MVSSIAELGFKAHGITTHGGQPADADRWETGWLMTFDDAMSAAREWAAEQRIDTIYVRARATQEQDDIARRARIDRISKNDC